MATPDAIDKCLSFISSQFKESEQPAAPCTRRTHPLAVTISRQSGSGAWRIAECLANYLPKVHPCDPRPWTVFDKELVEKVLEDHNLPKKLADYMPEDRVSVIDDIMNELFGLQPSSWTLVEQTAETILKLAELGNVILIGRGANIVTARLDHVFHVRLVGSIEKRLERVKARLGHDDASAMDYIVKTDRGRQRYLKEHYKADIDNPLLYDMVINTDRISSESAAMLIADALLRWAFGTSFARKNLA